MSKAQFIECQSQDSVIRALARKAVRLLNDPSLDRRQRETKVHLVQRDIVRRQDELNIKAANEAAKAAIKVKSGARHANGLPNGAVANAKQITAMRREFINKSIEIVPNAIAPVARKPLQLVSTVVAANDAGHRTLHLKNAHRELLVA